MTIHLIHVSRTKNFNGVKSDDHTGQDTMESIPIHEVDFFSLNKHH